MMIHPIFLSSHVSIHLSVTLQSFQAIPYGQVTIGILKKQCEVVVAMIKASKYVNDV